ncbi:hypothetical protein PR202_gb14380 [Eleusine coracana subsp. coracana]|uniref:Uncharacterized protein n=1 Tax=Eleusine coracana subsp. coracana TaxID=191504 RepID=A0AAV5EV86_ELECO|nr:hypothetical protein PR202_gb14380 [Eleusine coracana subsp. coracana]
MARPVSSSGGLRRRLIRSLDYKCVTRFRFRRLLAFLWLQRYDGALEELSKETRLLFRADHLQRLVQEGLWQDTIEYLYCFQPAGHMPLGSGFLVKFIHFISRVSESSTYEYDPYSPLQIFLHGGVSLGGIKLVQVIASMRPEQVRNKAAEIAGHLAAQIEGLDEVRRLPLCPAKAANVLPVALRRIHKKSSMQTTPYDLVRCFLSKKRLPSSSHPGFDLNLEAPNEDQLVDASVDDAFPVLAQDDDFYGLELSDGSDDEAEMEASEDEAEIEPPQQGASRRKEASNDVRKQVFQILLARTLIHGYTMDGAASFARASMGPSSTDAGTMTFARMSMVTSSADVGATSPHAVAACERGRVASVREAQLASEDELRAWTS